METTHLELERSRQHFVFSPSSFGSVVFGQWLPNCPFPATTLGLHSICSYVQIRPADSLLLLTGFSRKPCQCCRLWVYAYMDASVR